ncbi:MAG: hypothetical protein AAF654_11210 [Myxococcota bacterium]
MSGLCSFSGDLLRRSLLLESKGKLDLRQAGPHAFTLHCVRNRVEILDAEGEKIRVVDLGRSTGSAAARLLALAVVESLRRPDSPPAAVIEPEPEVAPENESAPDRRWSFAVAAVGTTVENGGRFGAGPSLELRLPALGWELRSQLALRWGRETLPDARLNETAVSAALALATSVGRDFRAGGGLRVGHSRIEATDVGAVLRAGSVRGWVYGPMALVEWAHGPAFVATELGLSLADGVAEVNDEALELLSGFWLRLSVGWVFDA